MLIWDSGQQVPSAYPILDLKNLSKLERWKKEVPKVLPNFQIGSNVQRANKLLVESFLIEEINPAVSSIFEGL